MVQCVLPELHSSLDDFILHSMLDEEQAILIAIIESLEFTVVSIPKYKQRNRNQRSL